MLSHSATQRKCQSAGPGAPDRYFNKQMLIHELIRGSLTFALACHLRAMIARRATKMLAITGRKIRLGFKAGRDGYIDHAVVGIQQQLSGVLQAQRQVILTRREITLLMKQTLYLAQRKFAPFGNFRKRQGHLDIVLNKVDHIDQFWAIHRQIDAVSHLL